MEQPVKKIIVLGGGSAGFLAAITMKRRLPQMDVTVIHSSKIPIIGVGEGSTFTMPQYLHGYLGIDPGVFHRLVQPTFKLGIRFLWGPRERFHYTFRPQLDARLPNQPKPNGFYCEENFDFGEINAALMAHDKAFQRQGDGGPLVNPDVAYHLENVPFVEFLIKVAKETGVKIVDDEVREVEQDEEGIRALHLESGKTAKGDLYLDCSGFSSLLLGKALKVPFTDYSSSLFCDRALVGGWERTTEPLKPYTTAETMDAGWSWQIEHDHSINRGYVYSSHFISDEDAEAEFRGKNEKTIDPRLVKYKCGAYQHSWVKNVVAIGNSNGFVEPLEATALAVICEHSAKLVQTLADADLRIHPTSRNYYNQITTRTWEGIRRFLALHYKFNTRIDNSFWESCREETDLCGAEEIIDYYQSSGPSTMWAEQAMGPGDPFGWEGYLVMLVGQKVPYKTSHQANRSETALWSSYLTELAQTASNGLSMRQSLDMIRSDRWAWKKDFYPDASPWG